LLSLLSLASESKRHQCALSLRVSIIILLAVAITILSNVFLTTGFASHLEPCRTRRTLCVGAEDDTITVFTVSVTQGAPPVGTAPTEAQRMATFLKVAPSIAVFVERARVVRAHQSFVSCLALLPGVHPMVVSGGHDGLVCLWDASEMFAAKAKEANDSVADDYNGDDDDDVIEPQCSFVVVPGRGAVHGVFCAVDLAAVGERGVLQRAAAASLTAVLRVSSGHVISGCVKGRVMVQAPSTIGVVALVNCFQGTFLLLVAFA
jgi:hypothetical protein